MFVNQGSFYVANVQTAKSKTGIYYLTINWTPLLDRTLDMTSPNFPGGSVF